MVVSSRSASDNRAASASRSEIELWSWAESWETDKRSSVLADRSRSKHAGKLVDLPGQLPKGFIPSRKRIGQECLCQGEDHDEEDHDHEQRSQCIDEAGASS